MRTLLIGFVACLVLVLIGIYLIVPRGSVAAPITASYLASEDTFVDAGMPDTAHGAAEALVADTDPVTQWILLRFVLPDSPDGAAPTSAKLRLFVANPSPAGGEVHLVDGEWSEAGTTWSRRPGVGALLATLPEAHEGQWVEADVTSAVAGSTVNLAVTTQHANGVSYRSREAGSEVPTLIVEWPAVEESPSPVPTNTTPSSIELPPTADATIYEAAPDANAGDAEYLLVDGEPKMDFLLKFEVSGVDGRRVISAKIRLVSVDPSLVGGAISRTASTSWSEDAVTWNAAPAAYGAPLDVLGPVEVDQTYEFDVTAAVAGDGEYGFRVTTPRRDGADYYSRESGTPPRMIVQLEDGPSPTATATATATSLPAESPTPSPTAAPPPDAVRLLTAVTETDPVVSSGDAADDPAIWTDPRDPARSLVIGTERSDGGGLHVYDLDGHELQFEDVGSVNNVDVRPGFETSAGPVDLVTATHTGEDDILIYRVDPDTRRLVDIRASSVPHLSGAYGYCMYHSTESGRFFGFVSGNRSGTWRQVEFKEHPTEAGKLTYSVVRTFEHPLAPASDASTEKMEGCVADDRTASLYLSEEEYGIHRYSAEPDGGETFETVATITDGSLSADIEGLTIYPAGATGGYLIASDQGADEFSVFELPDHRYVGRFSLIAGIVDGVTHTDGIAVTSAQLGLTYPTGLFVAQDDRNSDGNQNFKYASWAEIAVKLALRSGQ